MEQYVRQSGSSIVVPPGISVKPVIDATIPVATGGVGALREGDLAHATCRLEYSESAGRYEIAAFGLDRRQAEIEITGALWRTVRVQEIIQTVIDISLPLWTRPISDLRRDHSVTARDIPGLEGGSPDAILLTAVAYRIAEISNENPALAVAETLGLKQRTATNWIQRARTDGYFSRTDHEKQARMIAKAIEPLVAPPMATREQAEAQLELMRKAHGHR
ncbi:hypothetical protein [Microbacterium deminutum]|uniref:Uncharacterized protein n=1 Tax=Microbacterium deminutum TaxID=344164 RepID=A0ABN2Q607_9MICO